MDTFENRIDYLAKAIEAEQMAADATDSVIRKMYFEVARTYRSLARFTRTKIAEDPRQTHPSLDGELTAAETEPDQRFVASQPGFMSTPVDEITS